MTDLEIIKDKIRGIIKEYPEPAQPLIRNYFIEAIDAAERMAADNENLTDAVLRKGKRIEEYKDEIARLEAELERRPSVVRCGECRFWSSYKNEFGEGYCENYNRFRYEHEYCSAGVKKESEGKNDREAKG